ncbi:dUTP diphosphatase [Nesterenkonia sp. Act20]|uniref:dUTP diphosphatase n=1 Tax=Nesterenkonia sp. Act20 TaxID=1483432 RepID=UPI00350E3308
MNRISVPVRQLDPGLSLPLYSHPGDAGADLLSAEQFTLAPGERRLVPTGIALALPQGWVGLVHPRSGLAVRHGVTVLNAPGTVDAGYRGELKVCLLNTDRHETVHFERGDRIAQLVLQQVDQADFMPVADLDASERGAGGFGSTGR